MDAAVLFETFREYFPEAGVPSICRAPGRINLIGEHTDYNGLPVLPMAIGEEVRIAFAPRTDSLVRMRDVEPEYPEARFANAARIAPSPPGSWENYCKAAVQGLNDRFGAGRFPGMDLLVDGNIPVAAGLSSSSALVVAFALAYLRVLGLTLDKDVSRLELGTLLADAEHYVGTRGGGMDQAVILLARQHFACKIDFFPLRLETVPLPPGCVFVACDSMVKAKKTGNALLRYNAGPSCCKLICALVEKKAQEEFGDEIALERLGDLWHGHLCLTDAEVEDLVTRTFPHGTTPLAEASRMLGTSVEAIRRRWIGDLPEPPEGLALQARARHQLTEYKRVERGRDALLAADAEEFGRLMNESHESCARDYGVSCPELDSLVEVAREAGALGSRLTGAGFGGCTVNLVEEDRLEDFVEAVKENYYGNYLAREGRADIKPRILVARASEGAGYLQGL